MKKICVLSMVCIYTVVSLQLVAGPAISKFKELQERRDTERLRAVLDNQDSQLNNHLLSQEDIDEDFPSSPDFIDTLLQQEAESTKESEQFFVSPLSSSPVSSSPSQIERAMAYHYMQNQVLINTVTLSENDNDSDNQEEFLHTRVFNYLYKNTRNKIKMLMSCFGSEIPDDQSQV